MLARGQRLWRSLGYAPSDGLHASVVAYPGGGAAESAPATVHGHESSRPARHAAVCWLRANVAANHRPGTKNPPKWSRGRGYAPARSAYPGASSGRPCSQLLMGHGFLSRGGDVHEVVTREARVRTREARLDSALTVGRAGCEHRAHHGSKHVNTPSSSTRPHGRAVPGRYGCRSRLQWRCVANECLLCRIRHSRHYAASRTMPRHGGRIRPEPRDHVAPE
jgi:hypothetical protein